MKIKLAIFKIAFYILIIAAIVVCLTVQWLVAVLGPNITALLVAIGLLVLKNISK